MTSEYANTPAKHEYEDLRLEYLRSLNILDTEKESRFDSITTLVSKVIGCEIATVTLVDDERQWFKSVCGLDASETGRDISFCGHTINEEQNLIINDALEDERFKENPLVTGEPHIRSYAGIVIRGQADLPLGSLCAISTSPRVWSDEEIEILEILVKFVERELNSGVSNASLERKIIAESNMDVALNCLDHSGFEKIVNAEIARDNEASQVDTIFCFKIIETKLLQADHHFDWANKILLQCIDRIHNVDETYKKTLIARIAQDEMSVLFFDADFDYISNLIEKIVIAFSKSFFIGDLRQIVDFRYSAIKDISDFNNYDAVSYVNSCSLNTHYAFNEVLYYDDLVSAPIRRKNKIRQKLLARLEIDKNLSMHYQPKVSVTDDYTVCGYEALLRWHDEDLGGYVSPLELIDVADAIGLTNQVAKWVIARVLSDMRGWREEGCTLKKVSINLPSETIKLTDFTMYVATELENYGIEGKFIEFEILESSLIDDLDIIIKNINQLREYGVQFSIDDFGTGYSALHILSSLPISTLKIDKTFVDNLLGARHQTAIVKSIIDIAHDSGFDAVAEGVETYEQLIVLQAFGCDTIQGYYFSKPLPSGRIPSFKVNKRDYFH